MKMLSSKKLKAGALQYTLFVSVLVMLLVLALIAMAHVQQQLRLKNQVFNELVHENTLVFAALKNQSSISAARWANSTIKHASWGLFDVVQVHSKRKKEALLKTALLAGQNASKPALYLIDEQQPLVLVGDTKIQGIAYLPASGVKPGTIAGQSFQGPELIMGTTLQSSARLPEVARFYKLRISLDSLMRAARTTGLETLRSGRHVNSFNEDTKLLFSDNTLIINDMQVFGKVVIASDTKVVIESTADLHDLLIVAPEIEIKAGVQGSFQAFASENLTVEKGVELQYPSALVLIQNTMQSEPEAMNKNKLSIGADSHIKGIVAYLDGRASTNYRTQVFIDKGAVISGEVYCEQNVELKGKVVGSVYTRGFIANELGSVYKNHLYNTQISSAELPKTYAGLAFKNTQRSVAKWLY